MALGFTKIKIGLNLGNQSSDPGSANPGDFYYNTTSSTFRIYNGTWHDLTDTSSVQALSNKTLQDSTTAIVNTADATKELEFSVGGNTTGVITTIATQSTATGTISLPAVNTDTLVSRTSTDTAANRLKNKDLDDATVSIVDSADVTKKLSITTAGSSTGTTATLATSNTSNITLTLPVTTDTLVGRATTDTLTNKSLVDASTLVVNSSDATKKLNFSLGGSTTGTETTLVASQTANRTLTLPDLTDTLVSRTSTDTLSNKTLQKLIGVTVTDAATTGVNQTLPSGDIAGVNVLLTNTSLTSLSGITAGASGQQLILENLTTNSLTIKNNDSNATSANRIITGTSAAVTLPPTGTVSLVYDATNTVWMLLGINSSSASSSGGSKNYLSQYTASNGSGLANPGNGNFELGTTFGWSLAHSALSSFIPTSVASPGVAFSSSSGGSAASSSLSFTSLSSGQLAGSYSADLVSTAASIAGDMVISNAFFIDQEDQAKVMQVKFYYKNVSGTFNNSGTNSNTFAVWIYDATNAAWIMPAGVYNLVQGSGVGYCTATFQTTSSSIEYQVALININATTGAYSLVVDDFSVGPQIAPTGPAMTDWTAYTVIVTGSTSNPTKGTTSLDTGYWKRVGDTLHVAYEFWQTAAGSAGSGTYLFSLPPGLTAIVDTNAQSANVNDTATVGVAAGRDSTATEATGNVQMHDTTHFAINLLRNGNSYVQAGSGNNFNFAGTDVRLAAQFSVPIAGWSSNTSVSSDTDTRVVAMVTNAPPSNQTGITSATQVTYATPSLDTHSSFNISTQLYTIPVSGFYEVYFTLIFNSTNLSNGQFVDGYIYKNGSQVSDTRFYYLTGFSEPTVMGQRIISCKAGDTIGIYASANGSGSVIDNGNFNVSNVFTIKRLSGPAVVAATESVNAKYTGVPTGSLSTSFSQATIPTKKFDSHNAMSGGTYIIPVSGIYRVSAALAIQTTPVSGDGVGIQIAQAGSTSDSATMFVNNLSTTDAVVTTSYPAISTTFKCLAGDTIKINGYATGASAAYNSAADRSWFSIERIGN